MSAQSNEAKFSNFRSSMLRHGTDTNISIDQYVRSRCIELARSLDKRNPVYLDKRYWIIARDTSLNRRIDTISKEFLALLRTHVHAGRIFCPISDAVFIELMKQSDIDTRIATAHLIDEMSLGVTLIPESERVATELAHFLYSQRTPESLYPLTWLVWSKLSYVLGVFRPTNTGLPPHVELAFQKAGFDHFWDVTLAEMIDLISHNTRPPTVNFAALAQKLNESNRAHAKEIRSFAEAYVNEIAGALSLVTPTAMDIVEEMYQRDTDRTVHSSREERNLYEEQWCTILTNAFRFRKDTMARILPTLHVIASCHAVFRWDKQRQFEANDFIDFHHAAAALAYCDAFLTERSLQVLVSSNPLALDKLLDCRVISALPEAVSYLQDLP